MRTMPSQQPLAVAEAHPEESDGSHDVSCNHVAKPSMSDPERSSSSGADEDDDQLGDEGDQDHSSGRHVNKWTDREHHKLAQLVAAWPAGTAVRWAEIAQQLPGRTGKQCRERYLNHVKPDLRKGSWEAVEELQLIHWHSILGNHWSKISRKLIGRTENSTKNHWNAAFRSQKPRRPKGPLAVYVAELKAGRPAQQALLHTLETLKDTPELQTMLASIKQNPQMRPPASGPPAAVAGRRTGDTPMQLPRGPDGRLIEGPGVSPDELHSHSSTTAAGVGGLPAWPPAAGGAAAAGPYGGLAGGLYLPPPPGGLFGAPGLYAQPGLGRAPAGLVPGGRLSRPGYPGEFDPYGGGYYPELGSPGGYAGPQGYGAHMQGLYPGTQFSQRRLMGQQQPLATQLPAAAAAGGSSGRRPGGLLPPGADPQQRWSPGDMYGAELALPPVPGYTGDPTRHPAARQPWQQQQQHPQHLLQLGEQMGYEDAYGAPGGRRGPMFDQGRFDQGWGQLPPTQQQVGPMPPGQHLAAPGDGRAAGPSLFEPPPGYESWQAGPRPLAAAAAAGGGHPAGPPVTEGGAGSSYGVAQGPQGVPLPSSDALELQLIAVGAQELLEDLAAPSAATHQHQQHQQQHDQLMLQEGAPRSRPGSSSSRPRPPSSGAMMPPDQAPSSKRSRLGFEPGTMQPPGSQGGGAPPSWHQLQPTSSAGVTGPGAGSSPLSSSQQQQHQQQQQHGSLGGAPSGAAGISPYAPSHATSAHVGDGSYQAGSSGPIGSQQQQHHTAARAPLRQLLDILPGYPVPQQQQQDQQQQQQGLQQQQQQYEEPDAPSMAGGIPPATQMQPPAPAAGAGSFQQPGMHPGVAPSDLQLQPSHHHHQQQHQQQQYQQQHEQQQYRHHHHQQGQQQPYQRQQQWGGAHGGSHGAPLPPPTGVNATAAQVGPGGVGPHLPHQPQPYPPHHQQQRHPSGPVYPQGSGAVEWTGAQASGPPPAAAAAEWRGEQQEQLEYPWGSTQQPPPRPSWQQQYTPHHNHHQQHQQHHAQHQLLPFEQLGGFSGAAHLTRSVSSIDARGSLPVSAAAAYRQSHGLLPRKLSRTGHGGSYGPWLGRSGQGHVTHVTAGLDTPWQSLGGHSGVTPQDQQHHMHPGSGHGLWQQQQQQQPTQQPQSEQLAAASAARVAPQDPTYQQQQQQQQHVLPPVVTLGAMSPSAPEPLPASCQPAASGQLPSLQMPQLTDDIVDMSTLSRMHSAPVGWPGLPDDDTDSLNQFMSTLEQL